MGFDTGGFTPPSGGGNYSGHGGKKPHKPNPDMARIDGVLYKPFSIMFDKETPPPEEVFEKVNDLVNRLYDMGLIARVTPSTKIVDMVTRKPKSEVFVPFPGFDGYEKGKEHGKTTNPAKALACQFEPGINRLDQAVIAIIGIQVHVVMGTTTRSPSLFLITYSEDGVRKMNDVTRSTGRVGLAIKIASNAGIPVFNLKNEEDFERLERFITRFQIPAPNGEWEKEQFAYKPKD